MDVSMDLINRIRKGDMNAYETFVKQTWANAVRACWIILGEQRDAEEAAQDAYVNLFEKREQLREGEKFSPWFYRILMNSAKQIRRRQLPPSVTFQDDTIPSSDNFGDSDLRISVQRAMRHLKAEERTALVLRYFADLTDREAANVTGWHLGTFKWRLSKAKQHLGQILADENSLNVIQGGRL